jgi:hypothetical protein
MSTLSYQTFLTLPESIVDIIEHYIPIPIMIMTSKTFYLKYHSQMRRLVLPCNREKYIRSTINRDHEFVFKLILRENYERWFLMKNYIHKNHMYSNHINFVKSFCFDNDSLNYV